MAKKKNSPTANLEDVFLWLMADVFTVREGKVYKGERELKQRVNTRKGMDSGDARVDLHHYSKRRSCHVSQLVWMVGTRAQIPEGFEIHHLDEDFTNNDFDNLICVHGIDHQKFHYVEVEKIPF